MRKFVLLLLILQQCLCYAQTDSCIKIIEGKFYDPVTNSTFVAKGVNFGIGMYSYDNGSTYVLKPAHGYYPCNIATCADQASCDQDIDAYFKHLKQNLNINTLRITPWSFYPTGHSCGANTFHFEYKSSNTAFGSMDVSDLTFLAPYYKKLLDIAQANDLKVMMLLSGFGSECKNPTLQTIYDNYLISVAQACENHPALLAYDLWNEPQLHIHNGHHRTKSEICEMSTHWYDLMKANDPNHLITIGLLNVDAHEFSPDVFKADFFAYHFYGGTALRSSTHYTLNSTGGVDSSVVVDSNANYNNLQLYLNYYNTFMLWVKNNSNVPFMIGEAGFRANYENPADKRMDGDLITQAAFIEETFKNTINSGGLGYLWWQAYDVKWGLPTDPGQDNFGLYHPNCSTGALDAKEPTASTFKNLNPYQITGSAPAYPANYQNLRGNAGYALTGTVNGPGSHPIKDAIIDAWRLVDPNPLDSIVQYAYTNYTFTFTDAGGNYTLVSPLENALFPELSKLNNFTVNAVFHGYDYCSNFLPTADPFGCEVVQFVLPMQDSANVYISGSILDYLDSTNRFSAVNNLYIDNTLMVSLGPPGDPTTPMVFNAGKEIIISGENSISGVDNTIFKIEFDPNCDDVQYNFRTVAPKKQEKNLSITPINNAYITSTPLTINGKTIYLNREESKSISRVLLYPNPNTTGMLNIEAESEVSEIILINNLGQLMQKQNFVNSAKISVNIYNLHGGMYMVYVKQVNGSQSVHQLIIE